MSTKTRIALGVASILPLIYVAVMGGFSLSVVAHEGREALEYWMYEQGGLWVFVIGTVTMLLVILSVIGHYAYGAVRNREFDDEQKAFWLISLFLFQIVAAPVFWYRYIWKNRPEPAEA